MTYPRNRNNFIVGEEYFLRDNDEGSFNTVRTPSGN